MIHGRKWAIASMLTAVLAIASLSTPTFAAEGGEDEAAGPNTGNVSFSLGFDITDKYFFRGLPQENQGFIIQPWADAAFGLYESDGVINSVGLNFGIWNSFHSRQSFAAAGATADAWYEADLYFGVSVGFLDDFETSVTYVALTSPNGGFGTIQEIDWTIGYDDSGLWGDSGFALNPYIGFFFEIDGQADAGTDEGVGFEFGVEPSFEILPNGDYPVTFSVPLTLGLSLDDYYEGSGSDDTFGYFDAGFVFSVPLAFIPAEYGAWTASAGVHLIALGDNVAAFGAPVITGGDDFYVYGMFGISMEY